MVRRDEVGIENHTVEKLESMVSVYWDEEREILDAFQSMLKSLVNLKEGVFVQTHEAIHSDVMGEEYIKKLSLNDARKVSVQPIDCTRIFHAETGKNNRFRSFYLLSIDVRPFMFKKFGYWWLLSCLHGATYQVHLFKKRPKGIWLSGGSAIQGLIKPSLKSVSRYSSPLFELNIPRFTETNPLADGETEVLKKYALGLKNPLSTGGLWYKYRKNLKYVQADAVWDLTAKSVFVKKKRSQLKKDELPTFDSAPLGEGKPDDIVGVYESKLEVKRTYGSSLEMFNAWQNNFDYDEFCEEMGLDTYSKQRVILNNKHFKEGFMSESEYWDMFNKDGDYGGFTANELMFPYPTLYQYKTKFGIVNNLAI